MQDRLIVALDVPNALEGERLAAALDADVTFFKIGLGMLTTGGLALANQLKGTGKRVFLDMKLFDIGATVERAVRGLAAAHRARPDDAGWTLAGGASGDGPFGGEGRK